MILLSSLIIKGRKSLRGSVRISGAKNSVLALMAGALLADSPSVIENVPLISDVMVMADLIKSVGARVEFKGNKIFIDPSFVGPYEPPYDIVKKMRASYYLLGALLGKFKKASISLPGGCNIGVRPIDQHIKGFETLGAKVSIEHGVIKVETTKLIGSPVYLDVVSVGATINIMLSSVFAEGTTVIENAAKEPHIVDVANFLNAMGANIKGAGTDVIKIKGVKRLEGIVHTAIPDQIEAGTFMIAGAASMGDVTVLDVIPKHLESVTAKLREAGVHVEEGEDYIRVKTEERPKRVDIKTLPYPGFPTDLQQPMAVLLSLAEGTSIITENIWENRFKYLDELKRMGVCAKVEGRTAIIEGVEKLYGATVNATDLRAGAAMVIAGIVAEGETEVVGVEHIDRGYENIEMKFKSLGAEIKRI